MTFCNYNLQVLYIINFLVFLAGKRKKCVLWDFFLLRLVWPERRLNSELSLWLFLLYYKLRSRSKTIMPIAGLHYYRKAEPSLNHILRFGKPLFYLWKLKKKGDLYLVGVVLHGDHIRPGPDKNHNAKSCQIWTRLLQKG